MPNYKEFIGFREGLLGVGPVRLTLLANEPDWFSLYKPSGLSGHFHPWNGGRKDITSSIRFQIEEGKQELKRLEIPECHYICGPEMEISGPMILAKHKDSADFLRNALGSDQIQFRFFFVSNGCDPTGEFECDLPIAQHRNKPFSLISGRTGKKSLTRFGNLERANHLGLWGARTTFPRKHQIRLHAAESGIPVLGDQRYGEGSVSPKRHSAMRLPVFSGLAIMLNQIDLGGVYPPRPSVCADPEKPFQVFLEKCGFSKTAWKSGEK